MTSRAHACCSWLNPHSAISDAARADRRPGFRPGPSPAPSAAEIPAGDPRGIEVRSLGAVWQPGSAQDGCLRLRNRLSSEGAIVNAGVLVAYPDIAVSGATISRHRRRDGPRRRWHLSYRYGVERRSKHAALRNKRRTSPRDEEVSYPRSRKDLWLRVRPRSGLAIRPSALVSSCEGCLKTLASARARPSNPQPCEIRCSGWAAPPHCHPLLNPLSQISFKQAVWPVIRPASMQRLEDGLQGEQVEPSPFVCASLRRRLEQAAKAGLATGSTRVCGASRLHERQAAEDRNRDLRALSGSRRSSPGGLYEDLA